MPSNPTTGRSFPPRIVAGIMTGTSVDGIDVALTKVFDRGLLIQTSLIGASTIPFPISLRESILQIAHNHSTGVAELSDLHAKLGHHYSRALSNIAEQNTIPLDDIFCCGCHGQTVWHAPNNPTPSTLQIGTPAVIAEQTGISVVSDFRWRDLAAGGQAAPLIPVVDWLLLRHRSVHRIAINLGGIINLTFLPADQPIENTLAFDVSPGNMLLDRLTQELTAGKFTFDNHGQLAAQGKCLEPLLESWMTLPFIKMHPPKTTGREAFGDPFAQNVLERATKENWNLYDVLCTATHFAASAIRHSVESFLPVDKDSKSVELVVSGGGAHNEFLINLISEKMPHFVIHKSDAFHYPVDAKESMAFAILACLTTDGVAGNIPLATGAKGPRLLGSLTPGSTRNWCNLLQWMQPHSPS